MLLFSVIGFSQAVNDYRSKAAGNWSALASWERWNGASWAQPTVGEGYPGQNSVSGAVTIRYAAFFGFYSITLDVSPANNIGSLSVNTLVSLTTSGNPSLTVNGNLTVTALGTFTFGGTGNLSIGGASTINGFFTDNNGTGVSTFTGLVTMGAASTWTSTAIATTGNLIFQNGITNNSISFSAGGATFNTNNQVLSGATSATFANTVTLTVRLTNNLVSPDVLTISGDLAGAGQLTQGTNALVNIGGNATVAFLTATANPNTVTYNGSGAQTLL